MKNLFKITHIAVAILLLSVLWMAGQNIVQTFPVANMAAISYLEPQPKDYLWELNLHQAPLDTNKIRDYVDYYTHLQQIFPSLRDVDGVLGYCYHDLENDPKAVELFKTAIERDPDYFWNYYDLAAIYINEARYPEAFVLLQKAVSINPGMTLKKIGTSQMVYLPFLKLEKDDLKDMVNHLKGVYQTCIVLLPIISQAQDNPVIAEKLRKSDLILYAF